MLRHVRIAILVGVPALAGCAASPRFREPSPAGPPTGRASYYHDSLHGRRTASGAIYDRNALTAAHRTLPFGTVVRVKNLGNGRSVRVVVNDRGPFVRGRIIDLSRRAAEELGFVRQGLCEVSVEVIDSPG